jgi:hypothetical protein
LTAICPALCPAAHVHPRSAPQRRRPDEADEHQRHGQPDRREVHVHAPHLSSAKGCPAREMNRAGTTGHQSHDNCANAPPISNFFGGTQREITSVSYCTASRRLRGASRELASQARAKLREHQSKGCQKAFGRRHVRRMRRSKGSLLGSDAILVQLRLFCAD